MENWFESFVNSERCKTVKVATGVAPVFESFVNSERCKTKCRRWYVQFTFESFVNSERCKTINTPLIYHDGLRALLIQKDVKRQKNYCICLCV